MNGIFVAVSETPGYKGSIRISVAHRNRNCSYLTRIDRLESQIAEIPAEWLETEIFSQLGTCTHCWKECPR